MLNSLLATGTARRKHRRPPNIVGRPPSELSECILPNQTVLEYQCGDGGMLGTLEAREAVGVEPDTELAQLAIAKGLDVRNCVGDFAGRTFECVLWTAATDRPTEIVSTLTELRTCLRHKGRLVMRQFFDSQLKQSSNASGVGEPGWPHQSWPELFARAGFEPRDSSITRRSLRSSGLQLQGDIVGPDRQPPKYWQVRPMLLMTMVATKVGG